MSEEEKEKASGLADVAESCGCAFILLVIVLLVFSNDVVKIIQAIRGY